MATVSAPYSLILVFPSPVPPRRPPGLGEDDEHDTWRTMLAVQFGFPFLIRDKKFKLVFLGHTNFEFVDYFFYFFL